VLNQNAVIPGDARSPGTMKEAMDWVHAQSWAILQLPCPEFTFLGPDRPGMTYAQHDTPEYRAHCRRILQPVIAQLRVYHQHGYTIIGGMGIQSSPSCDPGRGVFMEELQALAGAEGIPLARWWQIPDTPTGAFDPDDPATFFGPSVHNQADRLD